MGWHEVGDPLELDVEILMDGEGMPMRDPVGYVSAQAETYPKTPWRCPLIGRRARTRGAMREEPTLMRRFFPFDGQPQLGAACINPTLVGALRRRFSNALHYVMEVV